MISKMTQELERWIELAELEEALRRSAFRHGYPGDRWRALVVPRPHRRVEQGIPGARRCGCCTDTAGLQGGLVRDVLAWQVRHIMVADREHPVTLALRASNSQISTDLRTDCCMSWYEGDANGHTETKL
jgi:hypothetical protein